MFFLRVYILELYVRVGMTMSCRIQFVFVFFVKKEKETLVLLVSEVMPFPVTKVKL